MTRQYKYALEFGNHGGEHVVGFLSKEVGDYWSSFSQDGFEEYVMDWDEETKQQFIEKYNVPSKFLLPEWYEIDDIDHYCAVEYYESNWCEVFTYGKGDEVNFKNQIANIYLTNDKLSFSTTLAEDVANYFVDNPKVKDGYLFFGQSFEKGGARNELILNEKFDVSRLSFIANEWNNGQLLLNSCEYKQKNGETKTVDEIHMEDSIGKSMSAWIEPVSGIVGR